MPNATPPPRYLEAHELPPNGLRKVIHVLDLQTPYAQFPTREGTAATWDEPGHAFSAVYADVWPSQISREVLTVLPAHVAMEVWQPDMRATQRRTHVYTARHSHSIFPAEHPTPDATGAEPMSAALVAALAHENPADTLIVTGGVGRALPNAVVQAASRLGFKIAIQFLGEVKNPYHTFLARLKRNPLRAPRYWRIHQNFKQLLPKAAGVLYVPEASVPVLRQYYKGPMFQQIIGFRSEFRANAPGEQATLRAKHGIANDRTVWLWNGRMVAAKGIGYLIDALLAMNRTDYLLLVSGSGPKDYVDALKAKAAPLLAQGCIQFYGFLPDADYWDFFRMADVFINTSLSEAGPHTSVKAMSVGTPVVSTDTGVFYEFLEKRREGLILPRMAPQTWATALNRLLDDGHQSLAKTPIDTARQFAWPACAYQIRDIYLSIYNG